MSIENLKIVFDMIEKWRKDHTGMDSHEVLECPICGGELFVAINSYNSHMRGECLTKGCVSWIE